MLMNDELHLFYKERELSNVKENISFKIDKNLKKELVKHFKGKYGDNGLTIGMNKMVEDYLNDTPLIRCNLPIIISLAVPKDDEQVYNLTVDDLSQLDDGNKDKLVILKTRTHKGMTGDVFMDSVPFQKMNNPNIWNVLAVDTSFNDFYERFNHLVSDYENIQERFNESISLEMDRFYDIDDVYVFHLLLNNFLDDESDGSYGNDGIHYGAYCINTNTHTYHIIIEFSIDDMFTFNYSCYLVTKEIFEDTLKSRNFDLYGIYQAIDIISNDDTERKLMSIATRIYTLKQELKEAEFLYDLIEQESLKEVESDDDESSS